MLFPEAKHSQLKPKPPPMITDSLRPRCVSYLPACSPLNITHPARVQYSSYQICTFLLSRDAKSKPDRSIPPVHIQLLSDFHIAQRS